MARWMSMSKTFSKKSASPWAAWHLSLRLQEQLFALMLVLGLELGLGLGLELGLELGLGKARYGLGDGKAECC